MGLLPHGSEPCVSAVPPLARVRCSLTSCEELVVRLPSAFCLSVPLRHGRKAICGLRELTELHSAHGIHHGVGECRCDEKDRRTDCVQPFLELRIRAPTLLVVEHRPCVLEELVYL